MGSIFDTSANWVRSYNPCMSIDQLSAGKWVVFGSLKYMKRSFPKVKKLVEDGKIYEVKYTHKENPFDPLPLSGPVMCVYADDMTKYAVLEELMKLGINPDHWKYNKETDADWETCGKLSIRSMTERVLRDYKNFYSK